MRNDSEKYCRKAVIAGAGPAGLTAALELLNHGNIRPVVAEASSEIGGISRTVSYRGNRIDIGGHRFFSKSDWVMRMWNDILPMQGAPSLDDILLDRQIPLLPGAPDPQTEDKVMLYRNRVSRIYYLRKFFDYPISLKWATFSNLGLQRTMSAAAGYLKARMHSREERSLEDFYINRFGKPLYSMFFEDYTTKVWGVHPSGLGADWGAQRVKGLSVAAILKDMILKNLNPRRNRKQVETSLIESFIYPKFGPGQLWEEAARTVAKKGGEILLNREVTAVNIRDGKVCSITLRGSDGAETTAGCDFFLSSMPIRDLIRSLRGIKVPAAVREIAEGLPYRDFITVGLLLDGLDITDTTGLKTFENRIPDTWIYIQERDVKLGRLQIFNNWSPYMVDDFRRHVWIGLEYFCSEGDELWRMDERQFIDFAIGEIEKIGVASRGNVRDAVCLKVKKAYPSYHGTYRGLAKVRDFLDIIPNLYCIGRNGQHRYNNMDHSMLTAREAVAAIYSGRQDKSKIWNVNSENDYHETK